MLNVSGLIAIPEDPQFKTTKTSSGFYLNFVIVSQDEDKNFHRYQANMWVAENELDEWEKKIETGNVFILHHGQWKMKDYSGGKYPIPSVQIDRRHFKKLRKAMWVDDED